ELLAVLEASGDLVVVADADWRITFVNTRAAVALGGGDDLIGRPWRDALPQLSGPIQRACELAMLARCRAEAEADLPGGRRVHAESHPREDGGIVVFLRDVTEARAAAARIAESEARLRMAVEATGLGTWDEDLVTGEEVWNERAFSILGLSSAAQRITPESWKRLVHPDDLPRVSAARDAALADGTLYRCEHRVIRADGEVRWVEPLGRFLRDANGRVVRFVGVFSDVTDRKAAEAALAESEARLRRVLDSLFVFVGVLTPEGTVLEVNRAPLEAARLSLAEVRGRPFWECAWWTKDAVVHARIRHACARAAKGDSSRFDVVLFGRDGQRLAIDFQIAPLRDAEGRITHLISCATDITARSAAEAALAESEGRLRMAQEAGEIGVFELVMPGPAHWSPTMFRLYGLDPAERGPWMEEAEQLGFLVAEERAQHAVRRLAMQSDPAQTRFAFEYRIRRADTGEVRWIASRGEVVRDAAGRARIVRGINQDVTDRRRAEERQMLLAREVDHRAKNALAVVQAIVALTRDADPARFRTAVIGRIAAMARAHTLLAREGWSAAELREIVEAEVAPHVAGAPGAPDRMSLRGPAVALQPDAAQPLAMAMHELATNAAKYGALSRPEGRVSIAWEATPAAGLVLRWTERGGPELDGPPARRGFGSSVIRNTVERQLGGAVSFFWQREGLECTLRLPPAQLRWPAAGQPRS
ncbi:PAS domain S-box protein, partial [Falsiroseomonas oryziterrae]|uniref:PAS domain S-box protein n=1 Tax=Falsiroseomonas oryziterrae TaxID=2911368 RepID=UPI001F1B8057